MYKDLCDASGPRGGGRFGCRCVRCSRTLQRGGFVSIRHCAEMAVPPPLYMQQQAPRLNPAAAPGAPSGNFFFNLEVQAWGTDLIRWRSIACFFWFGLAAASVVIAALVYGNHMTAAPTVALAALTFFVTSLLLLAFDLSDMHGARPPPTRPRSPAAHLPLPLVRGSLRQTRRERLRLFSRPSNIFRLLFNVAFGAVALIAWNVLVPLGPGGGRLILPCGRSGECAQIDVALALLAGACAGAAFAAHYIYTQRSLLRFPSLHVRL